MTIGLYVCAHVYSELRPLVCFSLLRTKLRRTQCAASQTCYHSKFEDIDETCNVNQIKGLRYFCRLVLIEWKVRHS